jgi:hypothetical protein
MNVKNDGPSTGTQYGKDVRQEAIAEGKIVFANHVV